MMKVSAPDGVKVYNISSAKTLPQWLSESKKKSLKKNEEYRRRLELLQDFKFPAACQKIKVTPDGQYIFASGYHPPQVKVYDLAQLSLKFDRHLDAEIVDFQILTEDYSKAVFLCSDRTLSFHARFGSYHKTRVPRFGRSLAYSNFTAELLVAGSAPEVWRLSLEEGRFMTSMPTRAAAINATGISPVHGLYGAAGDDGGLECFDLRVRQSVGWLDAATHCGSPGQELTSVRFDDTGLHVAVGTRNGMVALYDLRSQRPLVVKDHMYGSPIIDIKFHTSPGDSGGASRKIISSDKHIVKVWDANTGTGYTSIEPTEGDINDVCVWPKSGLIMVGCDSSVVQGYFIPSLGPAPRWCAHLEGLTEELEERAPTIYDDYRFVTKDDLIKLGLEHLIGTPMLRAYMHGFFVDNRLYQKASSLTQPFQYEQYRQQRIAQKLEDERKSRISVIKKLPKINTRVAAKMLAQEEEAAAAEGGDIHARANLRKKGLLAPDGTATVLNPMADDRFKAMFEDADFVVDENADEYKAMHPTTGERAKKKKDEDDLIREHFEQLDDLGEDASDDDMPNDDDDEDLFNNGRSSREDNIKAAGKGKDSKGARSLSVAKGGVVKKSSAGGKSVSMYAARDASSLQAFQKGEARGDVLAQTFAERVASQPKVETAARRVGGSREISFVPREKGSREGGGRGGGRGGGGGGRGRGGGGRGRGGGGRGGGGGHGRSW